MDEKARYLASVNNVTRLIIFVVLLCVIAAFGYATEIRTRSGTVVITWSNLEAVLKGEHLRAILAAHDDFSKYVNPVIAAKSEKESGADSFHAYATKIENYGIEVREGNEGYTIIFQLRLSDRFQRLLGNGGRTIYIVDQKTFKLIKIDKQK